MEGFRPGEGPRERVYWEDSFGSQAKESRLDAESQIWDCRWDLRAKRGSGGIKIETMNGEKISDIVKKGNVNSGLGH